MKICIKSGNAPAVWLILPTALITSRIVLKIIRRILAHWAKENNRQIPEWPERLDLGKYRREIRSVKKAHPGLWLVDIQSADGDVVKIKL